MAGLTTTLSIPAIAGEDFAGERKAFGGDDEGNDHLHAVAAFIATVAEAAQAGGVFGRVALEIGAGQVVGKDFVFGIKEVDPTLGELVEKGSFVFHDFVVAGVKAIGIGEGGVAA